MTRLLVTGGSGFIGSTFVLRALERGHQVLNLDALTYASAFGQGALEHSSGNYAFRHVDLRDRAAVARAFADFRPDSVVHLAAESHVDRSIHGPAVFVETNVIGTFNILEASLYYWRSSGRDGAFRFLHVSTDEVFGSLENGGSFSEQSPYDPRSPYAATKASADHLVRAWGHTYGLPILVTQCSNNYGPRQHPEKLIPRVIECALRGADIPVYGDGSQIRDWVHVDDHTEALFSVLERGQVGQSYAIGARSEMRNLDLVRLICSILDGAHPKPSGSYRDQIRFVADRPGHDQHYAMDPSKIETELGWRPHRAFQDGIRATVAWFRDHGRGGGVRDRAAECEAA